jgi:tetratricopeptide (TPR) repeat protein
LIFSEKKIKKTNLALALLVTMHANFSLAQDLPQEVSAEQVNTLELNDRESTTITWPLLSGESVQSLSTLFYPKNKRMQRLFIQRTLHLSQEIRPNLSVYTTTNQASLIVIPNIKYLAKHGGKIRHASSKVVHHSKPATQPELHMSYGLKNASQFALTPEMQTKYEDLVKRNERLKQDLEKLNAKLAHLQEVMAALNIEAKPAQNLPVAPQASSLSPTPVEAPVTIALAPEPAKPKIIKRALTSVVQTPASVAIASITEQESLISQYGLQILLALFVLGSILAVYRHRRRQTEAFSYFAADKFEPMNKKKFMNTFDEADEPPTTVDFSLTSSEFSGSISDNDLDVIMSLKIKEEGDLVLEQARIYANINREKEAIQILKAQIQSAPKASLDYWLAVLDIYRKTNQKEAFIESAHQLHQTFNVIQPTWDNLPLPMVIATSLLEFPHIIEPLMKLWGECDEDLEKLIETKVYLDALLTDNRDNERGGFGLEVLMEIKLLRDILDLRDKFSNQE